MVRVIDGRSEYPAKLREFLGIGYQIRFAHLETLQGARFRVPRILRTATPGSDVVHAGRPIFDDFFQHLWPYIGNNTANVVFQMGKRLWLIRIDQ
ncbi:hypothetical protein TNCV_3086421 [Trichonephila clavipes]|nr:hypothetical protein TNCV_3086421 [Trichonephila clavipes]